MLNKDLNLNTFVLLVTGFKLQGAMRLLQGVSTNIIRVSNREWVLERWPAASVDWVWRSHATDVIGAFPSRNRDSYLLLLANSHHHANILRAAQWPAMFPGMTGLTAGGANTLPKRKSTCTSHGRPPY